MNISVYRISGNPEIIKQIVENLQTSKFYNPIDDDNSPKWVDVIVQDPQYRNFWIFCDKYNIKYRKVE